MDGPVPFNRRERRQGKMIDAVVCDACGGLVAESLLDRHSLYHESIASLARIAVADHPAVPNDLSELPEL